jgi:anti-anti-sigma factor
VRADLTLRTIREPDGPLLIHLAGVIDAHTLDTFESTMLEAIEQGAREVVLDCEELRYVNSAGFGELIRYHDQLRENEGRLVLARVPPKVGVILEMLGLKSLIPVATGLDDARRLAREPRMTTTDTPRIHVSAPMQAAGSPALTSAGPSLGPTPVAKSGDQTVVCAVCDARLRIAGEGEWACASCGAPFTVTGQGGIAFDWSRAEADGVHLTFDVSPRTLAAFAGLLEGILVERRVSHARMRRFAREAAHVCHLLAENAFDESGRGPLHVLALAGPQRLHVRIVDRGRSLADRSERVFSTQKRLFLDFRYGSQVEGINITEFAFAYAGSGVFVA